MQPAAASNISSGLVAYVCFDKENAGDILTLLDIQTMERREIYKADSVKVLRWNKAGDKLLFVAGQATIGIYSLPEKKITQIKEFSGYDLRLSYPSIDWILEDEIVLRRSKKDTRYLCVLDKNLTEQMALKFPFSSSQPAEIRGTDNYVFAINTEKQQLWGIDLETKRWRRIY
jgi:hypothetical protein